MHLEVDLLARRQWREMEAHFRLIILGALAFTGSENELETALAQTWTWICLLLEKAAAAGMECDLLVAALSMVEGKIGPRHLYFAIRLALFPLAHYLVACMVWVLARMLQTAAARWPRCVSEDFCSSSAIIPIQSKLLALSFTA